METEDRLAGIGRKRLDPHSLGILIEWKQESHGLFPLLNYNPHSLGIVVEWKL